MSYNPAYAQPPYNGSGYNTQAYVRPPSPQESERRPLLRDELPPPPTNDCDDEHKKRKGILGAALTFLFIAALVLLWFFYSDRLSDDPLLAAQQILDRAPVIDGHIDLPILVRALYANNVTAVDLKQRMPAHVDIPRLRKGRVGAFFWSVYVECKAEEGPKFIQPSYRVRDTLEQIDVSRLLIDQYPDTFKFATSSDDIKLAIREGKIASLLGVEGAHQLGNSLGVLRQYHALGVRYLTLTHTCHNAFADSCGLLAPKPPLHNGLSPLGRALITELNRLGVLVDLSHTSDATARAALRLSRAPVIWSHSSARAVHDVPRNVPDEILRVVGEGEGKRDAVVMVNFAPFFVAAPGNASVAAVADHVEHIGRVAGRAHVGIGSDYDGIGDTPVGLEDVSTYPVLFAELYARGWTRQELAGLAGANLLRVLRGAEDVARRMAGEGARAGMELYDLRPDLPMPGGWGV